MAKATRTTLEEAFQSLWGEGREDDIKGYAEELFKILHKHKVPKEVIDAITLVLAEIEGNVEYTIQNYVDDAQFQSWYLNRFLNHIHLNGKIYIPAPDSV